MIHILSTKLPVRDVKVGFLTDGDLFIMDKSNVQNIYMKIETDSDMDQAFINIKTGKLGIVAKSKMVIKVQEANLNITIY